MDTTFGILAPELQRAARPDSSREAFEPLALDREMRIAVIGSGKAAEYHLKALGGIRGAKVACLVNRGRSDPGPLMRAHGIAEHYTDLGEAIRKCRVEAAIVCVTWTSTREVSIVLMEAGIHALIEKPLGTCVEEAGAIRLASEQSGVVARTAYNRRFFTASLAACDFVSSYGRPYAVTVEAPESLAKVRSDKYEAGEIGERLVKVTTHAIDFFTLFCGRHRSISGPEASRCLDGQPIDFTNLITFENGTTGVFLSHWRSPGDKTVTLHGLEYRVVINLSTNEVTFRTGKKDKGLSQPGVFDKKFKAGVYLQDYEFLRAVESRGAAALPAASIEAGYETMRLAEGIQALALASRPA